MTRLKLGVAGLMVLTLAAWALVPVSVSAQTDITGPWVVTIDTPQGKNDVDVTFKQDGEKLAGQVTSPLGSVDFSGSIIKTDLAITYAVPTQGQTIEIKMNGVVAADTMSGTLDFGGLGQVPWTAKRKPPTPAAAATPAPAAAAPGSLTDVTGSWNAAVQMGTNTLPLPITLKQEGEAVTGTINSPLGELPVTGTMSGSNLTLHFTAQTPQGDMAVTMTGVLGPDGLTGKSSVAGLGETDWSAKRVQ